MAVLHSLDIALRRSVRLEADFGAAPGQRATTAAQAQSDDSPVYRGKCPTCGGQTRYRPQGIESECGEFKAKPDTSAVCLQDRFLAGPYAQEGLLLRRCWQSRQRRRLIRVEIAPRQFQHGP